MTGMALRSVLGHIRGLAGVEIGPGDGELLTRFANDRDDSAFEAILRRHGPLVLRVCQRVLREPSAAEDAFQATFLIFLQKVGSISKGGSLASWLHGVAYRTAARAKANAGRLQITPRPEDVRNTSGQLAATSLADPLSESSWREARAVLDEELNRLPEHYRAPLVLCYLQGQTQEEAGRVLRLSRGALSRRLTRARKMLRARLSRRGVTLSVGLLLHLLADAAAARVPALLVLATLKAARHVVEGTAGVIPARVATLLDVGVGAIGLAKPKVAAAALAVVLLGVGAGLFACLAPPETTVGKGGPAAGRHPAVKPAESKGVTALAARATLERHGDIVWSSVFSPDGKTLVTVGGQWGKQGEVVLWDVATRKVRARVEEPMGVRSAVFSPDGKVLATADFFEGTIKLRARASGKVYATLRGHNREVATVANTIAFAPDGRSLVAGYLDGFVEVWDLAARRVRSGFVAHDKGTYSLAICPGGQKLATGGQDQTIKLWDLATGEQLAVLCGHEGPVENIAFAPDGKMIASASYDRTVRLWEVLTGQERLTLRGNQFEVLAVAFSPDGRWMASGGGRWGDAGPKRTGPGTAEVKLWDVTTGKEVAGLRGHRDRVFGVTFCPAGKCLASASWDRMAKLWDVPRPEQATPRKRTAEELDALWTGLADRNAARAYRALVGLVGSAGVVPYFKGRLKRAVPDNPRLARLIAELDDDAFAIRQRASAELEGLGGVAKPALRKAMKEAASAEVRRRAEWLLERPSAAVEPEQLRPLRAVEVLERLGTPEARELLKTLVGGADEARLTLETRASLERLAKRNARR